MKDDLRIILICIIIVLLIVISGGMIKHYLNVTTSSFLLQIKQTQEYINSDNWANANSTISSLAQEWNNAENTWALFINHHEMDNISSALKQASEYIKDKQKADALANLASLEHFIKHIPELQSLSLENIF